jgi:signal transduction histidine kinase
VAIRGARTGDELELAVGNSGPPLADHERARVFERDAWSAERADGARRGRGLGLYFCRLVAEAHGGTISAGRRDGLPVEFVLRLPA